MEAVILLAHGAPSSIEEVDEYVLRIRHGRLLEPHRMEEIRERYRLIGGSPLLMWTQRQAESLQKLLHSNSDPRKVYFGMRHSSPYIHDALDQMIADGVRSAVAICLAPQFSQLSIGAYNKAMQDAVGNREFSFKLVNSYAKHPGLIKAFATNLQKLEQEHPEAFVILTAHSLPSRVLAQGDPYDYQVKETATLVAHACSLRDWRFAYQSQGFSSEEWLGPTVESRLSELASKSIAKICVTPIGFVCDHVEVLYDIDIQMKKEAAQKGMQLVRAESLNDSPLFIELLYQLASQ